MLRGRSTPRSPLWQRSPYDVLRAYRHRRIRRERRQLHDPNCRVCRSRPSGGQRHTRPRPEQAHRTCERVLRTPRGSEVRACGCAERHCGGNHVSGRASRACCGDGGDAEALGCSPGRVRVRKPCRYVPAVADRVERCQGLTGGGDEGPGSPVSGSAWQRTAWAPTAAMRSRAARRTRLAQ